MKDPQQIQVDPAIQALVDESKDEKQDFLSNIQKMDITPAAPAAPAPVLTPTPVSSPTPSITLSEEQELAIAKIMAWFKASLAVQSKHEYKLGGYAGTGKTTIIKFLLSELRKEHRVRVMAFTGKACAVLRRKGVQADTMHSQMYQAEQTSDGWKFWKRDFLERDPDLVIIDEASMISSDLYNDLMSFGIPVLFVGDPGQLEPVGDNPRVMNAPDFVLSKIHRQAEKSPIITLANRVRTTGQIDHCQVDGLIVQGKDFATTSLMATSQVLCARNKTRKTYNDRIRLQRPGFAPNAIIANEKLIVLKNNLNYRVFNGLILFVDEVLGSDKLPSKYQKKEDGEPVWWIRAHDEVGNTYAKLPIWQTPFKRDLKQGEYAPRHVIEADYGYVITCHKSQGSEWEHVFVIDEYMPPTVWDMKRWRYTAITRAAERLTYAI